MPEAIGLAANVKSLWISDLVHILRHLPHPMSLDVSRHWLPTYVDNLVETVERCLKDIDHFMASSPKALLLHHRCPHAVHLHNDRQYQRGCLQRVQLVAPASSGVLPLCRSYYHINRDDHSKITAVFPGPVSLFWWMTCRPPWDHWNVVGTKIEDLHRYYGQSAIMRLVSLLVSLGVAFLHSQYLGALCHKYSS
ncbi:hypothetical protein F5146DRAFT_1152902 [Armillaria mellea]|nr:hypothetical protein F5146DRAFT_1152902 [Armillaria mellea]